MVEDSKRSRATVWVVFAWGLTNVVGLREPAFADTMSNEEFDARVRDCILANPEVIMQVVQSLEARQREAEEKEAQTALASQAEEVFP